jgi:PHYB activation tagged suppressor 1
MVAAAVAAVVASWAFDAVVKLVWRPRAITRRLRAQGVGGPGYRFFSGNLGEIKRLRDEGAGVVLDVSSHDFVPIVQPHFRKWIPLYGTLSVTSPIRSFLLILTKSDVVSIIYIS